MPLFLVVELPAATAAASAPGAVLQPTYRRSLNVAVSTRSAAVVGVVCAGARKAARRVGYDCSFVRSAWMATDATPQPGIRLQLLAEPTLDLGSESFPLERKDAALLALLAIDGVTARGKAAALLWPDVDDDAARNNLRQRLHRLRKRAGRDVALTTGDALRLADGVSHDLSRVAETLAQGAANATGELLGSLDYADCDQLGMRSVLMPDPLQSRWRWALAQAYAMTEGITPA